MTNALIPYGRQSISEADIAAVVDVLRADFLTQGPAIEVFEEAICGYTGANFAVACSSGTAALHLACLAIGLTAGDLLWTSPMSFAASANCARFCNADVDFVDIDPATGNMSAVALAAKLRTAHQLPKALVLVHFAGLPGDLAAINELCKEHAIILIEDAAHALGAEYQEVKIGACQYSDFTTFSLHPVKIITAGEGGVVTTNNPQWAQKLQVARSHGITKHEADFTETSHGGWYYEMQSLGYNYRLTDIQAALANSQLTRLDEFIKARQTLAANYDQALANLPIRYLPLLPDRQNAYHLDPILCTTKAPLQREALFAELHKMNIGCQVHYIPIHLLPYYQKLGFKQGDFPAAEHFYQNVLSLPMFPALTNAQQQHVINTLKVLLS